MNLGPWTPSFGDSGWHRVLVSSLASCENVWHLQAPHLPKQPADDTSDRPDLPHSRKPSLPHPARWWCGDHTLRQSSNGPRSSVHASFPTPSRCYRVCWSPAPVLLSEMPWSARELCTVFGTFQLIPFSARAPFGGSLGLGVGEGRSALPFSHEAPTAWPLPCRAPWTLPSFSSPNLAAEEAQIPQLDPKTSSGTLSVSSNMFSVPPPKERVIKEKEWHVLDCLPWFLFPKPSSTGHLSRLMVPVPTGKLAAEQAR